MHTEVNNGRKSAILNLIDFNFSMAYPFLKLNISFHGSGLAVWHGLQISEILKYIKLFWPRDEV